MKKKTALRYIITFTMFLATIILNLVLSYVPVLEPHKMFFQPVFFVTILVLGVLSTYFQLRIQSAIPPWFGIGLNAKELAQKITPHQKYSRSWWDSAADELYDDIRSVGASHKYALECCYIAERYVVNRTEFRTMIHQLHSRSASPTQYALARQEGLDTELSLLVAAGELEVDLARVL